MEERHETKKKDASIIMTELHPQLVLKGMSMLVAHVPDLTPAPGNSWWGSWRRRKNAEQITIRREKIYPSSSFTLFQRESWL